MKILVIEDDAKTAEAVRRGLVGEGYEVAVAGTGEEGFFEVSAQAFDLVVLDWMLPGRSGIEILKAVRIRSAKPPVLLLTARDSVEDLVVGLERVSASPSPSFPSSGSGEPLSSKAPWV